MACVNKHKDVQLSEEEMEKVCRKEFVNLRRSGIDGQLLFHNINRPIFAELIARKLAITST